jgi:hypothetical protein
MAMLRIVATEKRTGACEDITCLRWFEHNMVHDWTDRGYLFEIFLDEILVWSSAVDTCIECNA